MRLVILWAGIAAFVWVGLHPPMTSLFGLGPKRHSIDQIIDIPVMRQVDIGCLLGRWGAVVALTGALFYTEPRLTPWVRAKRRVISGTILGVLLLCLITLISCGAWSVWASQIQGNRATSVTGRQENTALVSNITAEQARAELRRREGIRLSDIPDTGNWSEEGILRGVNNFFNAHDDHYQGIYGKTVRDSDDWTRLTPEQRQNRKSLCDQAQSIRDVASATGRQVTVAEALKQAHLSLIGDILTVR